MIWFVLASAFSRAVTPRVPVGHSHEQLRALGPTGLSPLDRVAGPGNEQQEGAVRYTPRRPAEPRKPRSKAPNVVSDGRRGNKTPG